MICGSEKNCWQIPFHNLYIEDARVISRDFETNLNTCHAISFREFAESKSVDVLPLGTIVLSSFGIPMQDEHKMVFQ